MRLVKWVLGIVVVVVVLGLAALFLIPTDRIAGAVADRFEASTGRSLTIGDVSPSISPLGVTVRNIGIANADWAENPEMLTAGKVSVAVELGSIFSGSPRVRKVEIENPVIHLERSTDGAASWDFGGSSEGGDSSGAPAFTLDDLTIVDGQIRYSDGEQVTEIDDLSLSTALPGLEQPMELIFSAQLGGDDLKGSVSLSRAGALTQGGAADVSAQLELGEAEFDIQGSLDLSADTILQADLGIAIPDTGKLMVAAGLAQDDQILDYFSQPNVLVDDLVRLVGGDEASEAYKNFVRLLAENNRLSLLPEVAELFQYYSEQDSQSLTVDVYSAIELTGEQREAMTAALNKRMGKQISLNTHIDESLMGGARIHCGDLVIDGTLRGKIDRLKTQLFN